MSEYKLTAPISVFKLVVRDAIKNNEVLPIEYATMDLMVAMDAGNVKPYRYYAKRWGWKDGTTYDRLPRMKEVVYEWRDLSKKKSPSKRPASDQQATSKKRANQPLNGVHPSSVPAVYQHDPSSIKQPTTSTSTISEDKSSSVVSKTTCEWTNDFIVDSWNNFAREHNLKTIRSLSPKRREWLRLRRKKLGPVLDEIYTAILREPYLTGKVVDWSINFDYLWRNSDNYIKILEGGHWPMSNGNYNGKMNGESIKPYKPRRFNT